MAHDHAPRPISPTMRPLSTRLPSRPWPALLCVGCSLHIGRPAGALPVGEVEVSGAALDPAVAVELRRGLLVALQRCGALAPEGPALEVRADLRLRPGLRGVDGGAWLAELDAEVRREGEVHHVRRAEVLPTPSGALEADAARAAAAWAGSDALLGELTAWVCAPGPPAAGAGPVTPPS